MRTLWMALGVALVFAFGGAAGFLGARIATSRQVTALVREDPDGLRRELLRRLLKRHLKLRPEQVRALDPMLDAYIEAQRPASKAYRKATRPHLQSLYDGLRPTLSPEQRRRLEQLRAP